MQRPFRHTCLNQQQQRYNRLGKVTGYSYQNAQKVFLPKLSNHGRDRICSKKLQERRGFEVLISPHKTENPAIDYQPKANMTTTSNNALFLVGGTGGLGKEVAKGLVTAPGFDSRKALVRDTSKGKDLEDIGWELVQVSDFQDSKSLQDALVGAKTVVSTVGGGDLVRIEKSVLTAAKAVGASLFVPSQFGVDFRRWGATFPFLEGKKQVLDAAKDAALPTLCVFTGYFSDLIFSFLADPANAKGMIVGDGTAKISFTRRSDIGFVLAKALSDPKYSEGGFLSIQGDNTTWKNGLATLEKVLDKKLEIEGVDAQDALQQERALLQKATDGGDMGAFYTAFKLHLLGAPARGNTGCDVSSEAITCGVDLQSLEQTLTEVYGSK